jgi:hypothetical protein
MNHGRLVVTVRCLDRSSCGLTEWDALIDILCCRHGCTVGGQALLHNLSQAGPTLYTLNLGLVITSPSHGPTSCTRIVPAQGHAS